MRLADIDFLIIGAAKSATTWLHKSLQSDPTVSMPDPELHYFSREYQRGHDWYLSQFDRQPPHVRVGEKSNSYLDGPRAPPRVHEALPHVRLIAQLRNPVERAYSDYCMLFRRGEVGRNIDDHLDPRRADGNRFLSGGLYHRQIEAYLELYPRERLQILFYEDLRRDPQAHLAAARAFLGLPEASMPTPVTGRVKDKRAGVINPALKPYLSGLKPLVAPLRGTAAFDALRKLVARPMRYATMSTDLRQRLVDYYAPEAESLGRLVGHDLTSWLRDRPGTTPAGGDDA